MSTTRVLAVALLLVVSGCSGSDDPRSPAPSTSLTGSTGADAAGSPTGSASAPAPARSDGTFDGAAALGQADILAARIGPREATAPAYREAATLVAGTLLEYGFRVRRQTFAVPAGTSAGTSVPAGTTQNIVARPPGFDLDEPFRVVVAHLDTVPGSPGAEDDASGIGVLLELARMTSTFTPKVPVVFVALGAEEPRGPADEDRLYGSRHLLGSFTEEQRRRVLGLVSLDGVGVRSSAVPLCTGTPDGAGTDVADQLTAAARAVGVRVAPCQDQDSAHWPFEQSGLPAARLGGTAYSAEHTPEDLPALLSPAQLARVGQVALEWVGRA